MSLQPEWSEDTSHPRFSPLTQLDFGVDYTVWMVQDDRFDGAIVCIVSVPRFGWAKGWLKSSVIPRAHLYHPHVLKLYDVFSSSQEIHVVYESPKGEDLLTLLKSIRFTEDQTRFIFQQLVFAVSYLHSMGIEGIDLIPERIFYDVSTGILKIGDLGLHDVSGNGGDYALPYVSREQLSNPDGTTAYQRESDVWHLGAILYFVLFKRYPFCPSTSTTVQQHIFNILRVHWSIPKGENIGESCLDLLRRIFTKKSEDRITIPEIQNHPWYKQDLPEGVLQYESIPRPDDGLIQNLHHLADHMF